VYSYQAEAILEALKTCHQAEPHEYCTNDQEEEGQLNDGPVSVAGQEEEENPTEQDAQTNAQESTKSILEGRVRYELLADLAGRTAPMLPAEALLTSRTHGARHGTAWCLAADFGHNLTP